MDIFGVKDYHCPRWEELPALPLYMDQVLFIVEDALRPLIANGQSTLTSTMINNYVKMKIIAPSEKKKYSREHLAQLIMLSLFKHVLSMVEISGVFRELESCMKTEQLYNVFCEELERCLVVPYLELGGKDAENVQEAQKCPALLSMVIKTLVGKLILEHIVAGYTMENTKPAKK